MRKFGLIFSLVTILTVAIFSSCNKQKEEKLKGRWTLTGGSIVNIEDYSYFFTFTDQEVTISTKKSDSDNIEECASGNYVVKNNVLTIGAQTVFCQYLTYSGDWDIETLKSNVLIIRQTSNGTNTLEFVK